MHVLHVLISTCLVGSLLPLAACRVEPDVGTALPEEVTATQEAISVETVTASDDSLVACRPATETYTFDASVSPYVDALRNGVRIARFTVGSRTVNVLGYKNRSFSTTDTDENTVNVRHPWYVRTLPSAFATGMTAGYKTTWLRAARRANCDNDKDILTIASQYAEGRKQVWSEGLRLAGNAEYELGCDFHDYLGTDWQPPDGPLVKADLDCQASGALPDPDRKPNATGSLDCSGLVRMVYGARNNFTAMLGSYNAHIPASVFRYPTETLLPASHLPRRSHNLYRYGPGRKIIPFRVSAAPTGAELAKLLPGDLVFFNLTGASLSSTCCEPTVLNAADTCCEEGVTHVGIFMGREEENGKYRIISSRDSMSGPTMGGTSYLSLDTREGWSKRFRAARRL